MKIAFGWGQKATCHGEAIKRSRKKEKSMRNETHPKSVLCCIVFFCSAYAMAGTWQSINPMGYSYNQLVAVDGSKMIDYTSSQCLLYDGTTWSYLPEKPGSPSTVATCISGDVIGGQCYNSAYTVGYGYTYNGSTWTTYMAPWATGTTTINGIDGSNFVGEYWNASGVHGFSCIGGIWMKLDYPRASTTKVTGISGDNVMLVFTTRTAFFITEQPGLPLTFRDQFVQQ